MHENAGKMRARIIPNTETFYAVPFSRSRNSKLFAYFDIELALSFATIGSIATATIIFMNNAVMYGN